MSKMAVLIEDSLWDNRSIPGAIKYWTVEGSNEIRGFNFTCPCGCERIGSVRFEIPGKRSGWWWNGSQHIPSIKPSINLQIDDGNGGLVSHWHGFLTDGVFS